MRVSKNRTFRQTGSPYLHRAAAQHDLPVKGQEHAGMSGSRHGKGGAQIVRPVGKHVRQGQLRAGEHHRQVDIRQHEGDGGGGVGHGVGAVGDHDAVKSGVSALAEYSDIVDNDFLTFALPASAAKKIPEAKIHRYDGDIMESWRYDPRLLNDGKGLADPLSLKLLTALSRSTVLCCNS